jgi:site-specific DNA-methyltransferase (adenine-specific)
MFSNDDIADIVLQQSDCEEILSSMVSEHVDLVVTSPPYDTLRTYDGTLSDWNEDKWKRIIKQVYRVVKPGGVVVWVVNDKTDNGSETGTSFRLEVTARCSYPTTPVPEMSPCSVRTR